MSRSRRNAGLPRAAWGLGVLAVLTLAALAWVLAGSDAPIAQPVVFSHRVHAAEVGIDCQFCHAYARRSSFAGLPAVATCRGCHLVVKPESEAVQPIHQAWERQEPIEWMQVHDVAEFVRFDHSAHISRGVQCATCHGDVAAMETAQRRVSHTMGFCLDCHQRNEAPTDCLTCHH